MKNEFIPYEQALALKELGFNEPCFGRYIYDGRGKEWFLVQTQQTKSASVIFEGARSVDGISVAAPLYHQAFRWFREKYGLHPHFCFFTDEKLWNVDIYAYLKEYGLKTDPCTMKFKAYEEAEYACLNKLIEIFKSNTDTP
jgi:hypothetical protein